MTGAPPKPSTSAWQPHHHPPYDAVTVQSDGGVHFPSDHNHAPYGATW